MSRRGFLAAGALGGVALVACGRSTRPPAARVARSGESHRRRKPVGRTPARPSTPSSTRDGRIDLGGTKARTTGLQRPGAGPVIRANIGDDSLSSCGTASIIRRRCTGTASPSATTWTAPRQSPNIAPGSMFTYRFSSPYPGHLLGTSAHRPGHRLASMCRSSSMTSADPGSYDAEWIVMLDDWTSRVGTSPSRSSRGCAPWGWAVAPCPGCPAWAAWDTCQRRRHRSQRNCSADGGDVSYPYYVINGRIPAAATTFTAKAGQRIRIHLINAGADTAFRVALADHRMTVCPHRRLPGRSHRRGCRPFNMGGAIRRHRDSGRRCVSARRFGRGQNAVARAASVHGRRDGPDVAFVRRNSPAGRHRGHVHRDTWVSCRPAATSRWRPDYPAR